MKHLPIAKTELHKIVEGNFLYVDKTHYIRELVDDGHEYYFLSRPRRFGKSLFVDTLRAAFAGEKELFKGLYLEHNWDWDIKYPVVKISFGGGTVSNKQELKESISFSVRIAAENYNIALTENFIPNRFKELIILLFKKENKPVVILIDEYDKPLLDNLTKDVAEELRDELSSFYSVLKEASKFIKFVFLTGVSKFSKTSLFSKLNNLTDISLVAKYADICGITQKDLDTVFAEYLIDVDKAALKNWYDGYNFRGNDLYNPYDLLMFLWEKEYKAYWFKTGTPTFLLELIKKRKFYIPTLEDIKISESQMEDFDIDKVELDVLLFQTGYLTIKNYYQVGSKYIYNLRFPNLEVKMGFNDYLLRMFYGSGANSNERTILAENIYFAIHNKQLHDLKKAFISFFAGIPSDWYRKNNIAEFEGFYCSMFYAIFASVGLNIKNEDTTNKGRIDFTVTTNDGIYIFEIKMKRIQQNALSQIKEKKYHEKYLSDNKDIFLVGIEFDEEEKNISGFEWEKIMT